MEKHYNERFNECYYTEILDNGLHVTIWPKKDFSTTKCIFGTAYGSFDAKQKDNEGNIVSFPNGIAHFLEHKLFENEDVDVMNKFAALGSYVNAYTSFQETAYYFSIGDKDIYPSLNLLLDFVQNLNITEQSVEKEKGIINQELNMYLQQPDSRLIFELFKAMYVNHPYRYDIGGDEASVNSITLEDLNSCYKLNYHPSNMYLDIVTPCDIEEVMKAIKDNQNKKTFDTFNKLDRYFEEEPKEVAQKLVNIKMPITNTKVCLGYKLTLPKMSDKDVVRNDILLRNAIDYRFTQINPEYQNWLDTNTITSYFMAEEEIGKDASMLIFANECNNENDFKAFIDNELKKMVEEPINEEILEMYKKKGIGEYVNIMDNPDDLATVMFRRGLEKVSIFELVEMIESITIQDEIDFIKSLDFSQCSIVKMEK